MQADAPPEAPHAFVATHIGRFAQMADLSTLTTDAPGHIRLRVLQVADADSEVAGERYRGGWSWWAIDCAGRTVDRLDFASLREDGVEGPVTPERQPAYPIAAGGEADELAAVACATRPPAPQATTVAEAVRLGRAAINE